MTYTRRSPWPGRFRLLLLLFASLLPVTARGEEGNRLRRIQILPHAGFTRINLFFQDPPDYALARLPQAVRLRISGADAPAFRRLRAYRDPRIAGVFCADRNGAVELTVALTAPGSALQALDCGNPAVLSLIVGPAAPTLPPEIAPGREPILAGTEQFVRRFGVPAAALPFQPTDPTLLKSLLPQPDQQLFRRAEGLLYREQGDEALEIFSSFLSRPPAVRALAWYRLGETLTLLERNEEALAAFRQAEALWPAYLDQAPELLQAWSEARARTGDFPGARTLLARLMDRFVGTIYAPQLLNRLAYLWERQGATALALDMYRTVVAHAPGSEAAARARLKLADHDMFSVARDRYRLLAARYDDIYQAPGSFSLRDEALFKGALLHALYGPAGEALQASVTYDRRYPRGTFSTIVKKMREELLLPVYRDLYAAHDQAGLARLALDNREYLASCFGDADFAPRLAQAFRGAGLVGQELELFGYLGERGFAAAAAPFLGARLVEDALARGELALADSAGRRFLARFPRDARVGEVREELARIAFERGDLRTVLAELSFLKGKGGKAHFAESDYYLGKAQLAAGDQRGAELSLARFTAAAPAGSPFLTDGYLAMAGARASLKQYPAALSAYREGAGVSAGESAGQCLYKMGELYLQLNRVREARDCWQKAALLSDGGTWVKLAGQALDDLKWRLKIAGELP